MAANDLFIHELGMAHNPKSAARLVERTFNEGRPDQYKRELTRNSLQAGAENILATAFRPPNGEDGTEFGFKAAFVDDGIGMTSSKIVDYLADLFNGANDDGNFQMGARVSTLPFNHFGFIVASWTEEEPEGTILEVAYDEDRGVYGVVPWYDDSGAPVDTGYPEDFYKHPVIERAGHGTVFILMGSSPEDNTLGEIQRDARTGDFIYPDTRVAEGDWNYYNSKYWVLPEDTSIRVMWANSDIESWFEHFPPGSYFQTINEKGPVGYAFNYRRCLGARERIETYAVPEKGGDHGQVKIKSSRGYKATVHWALFPQAYSRKKTGQPAGNDQTQRGLYLGLFGELHGDEIYNVQARGDCTRSMEWYGISRKELRERMVLIVEPEPRSTTFIGAQPSSARDRLLIANESLPHDSWGEAFADQMPDAIRKRLAELNGENSKDEEDRQRKLWARFKDFYGRPFRASDDPDAVGVDNVDAPNATLVSPRGPRRGVLTPRPKRRHRKGTGPNPQVTDDAPDKGVPRNPKSPAPIQPVWDAELFEDTPGYIAHFLPSTRQLQLNPAHPLVKSWVKDARAQRRSSLGEDVERAVQQAAADHLINTILGAELFMKGTLTNQTLFGKDFIDLVTSDRNLLSLCLNLTTMEKLIGDKFKGRTGYGKGKAA